MNLSTGDFEVAENLCSFYYVQLKVATKPVSVGGCGSKQTTATEIVDDYESGMGDWLVMMRKLCQKIFKNKREK